MPAMTAGLFRGIKMKISICNAFSLSMLDRGTQLRTPGDSLGGPRYPVPVDDPAEFLKAWESHAEIISAVGHADTAAVFSAVLGRDVPANRISVKLDAETKLLVGQYIGPRLPEGATQLPEGSTIEWWVV